MKSKRKDETFQEYKQRVLDPKSASFCGAKWYNATIWLGSGQTTSCHHPLPHKIAVEAAIANSTAIHNTPEKKEQRRQMQSGERPAGCEYCWRIEDSSPDAISDRPYKSMIYSEEELAFANALPYDMDVNLRTLEIAFDRTCNFACSYCNPAFSTTWVKDIKQNGPYQDLTSDGRNHFTHTHSSSQLYNYNEPNPYVEAFFKWWESDLHSTLRELRITGGEPLMSADTWRLFDWYKNNKSDCLLAINSNLGAKDDLIDRLIAATHDIPNMELYTSCEAMGLAAEYIRDGLEWSQWTQNVERVCSEGNLKAFHMMCTINGLCLPYLPQFLEWCVDLKRRHGRNFPTFTLNILRFPSFQSPTVMPDSVKEKCAQELEQFINHYTGTDLIHEMELEHVRRLITYLRGVEAPHAGASPKEQLVKDFKIFYSQYSERRNKSFETAFPQLVDWYHDIQL